MFLEHCLHYLMPFPYYLFILLCFCVSSPSCAACDQFDHHSLLSSFSTPPSALLNWSNADCCQWEGVACDSNGRVTRLWLPSKGLRGTISPSITNLTCISHLNLSHNRLTGSLPDSLFSALNLLEVLDLSHNLFRGELSLSLNGAGRLLYLNVSSNMFTGIIPSSLCAESASARLLDLSANEFSGVIPRGLGGCLKLEVLRMGFNSLSGMIPKDIYRIPTLREVNLASNRLQGPIGSGIGNLTSLTILELQSNELSDRLPWDMGKLSKLEKLVLELNHLNGTIPTTLMNCTHLRELKLGLNFFEGKLSELNFSKLLHLRTLDLFSNFFTGKYPISLYSCKFLRAIRLSNNKLEGKITSHMLNLQSLSFLSLAGNELTNFTRTMRILIGCKKLSILILSKNFEGEVMPEDIDIETMVGLNGFQNLRVFGLSRCSISGNVPIWLKKLRNLQVLNMPYNELRGSIPNWLGTLPNLLYIDLSDNHIQGVIPRTLCNLRALTTENSRADYTDLELPIFFTFYSTKITNPRDGQYNRLSDIPRTIALRNNSLYGIIPIEIDHLKLLQYLDLSDNNLSGSILDEFSKLSSLERLNLSMNHLSGRIPDSLSGLNFLREFNVSYNNLQGIIPKGTQLQSFGASAYKGNKKLCGPPLSNQCQDATVNEHGKDRNDDETDWLIYISAVLGFIVGFSTICCTLLFSRSWRYAYFHFLTNIRDRLWVMGAFYMEKLR